MLNPMSNKSKQTPVMAAIPRDQKINTRQRSLSIQMTWCTSKTLRCGFREARKKYFLKLYFDLWRGTEGGTRDKHARLIVGPSSQTVPLNIIS